MLLRHSPLKSSKSVVSDAEPDVDAHNAFLEKGMDGLLDYIKRRIDEADGE
jgi:hypothetical protein